MIKTIISLTSLTFMLGTVALGFPEIFQILLMVKGSFIYVFSLIFSQLAVFSIFAYLAYRPIILFLSHL